MLDRPAPTEIGVFEAKAQFSRLAQRVAAGEEIVVTRHGKPVMRLLPPTGRLRRTPEEIEEMIAGARALREDQRRRGFAPTTWAEVKSWARDGLDDE